jgi:nucleoside-diphosphate-sugar epimerase
VENGSGGSLRVHCLVTGATGYLGQALVAALLGAGFEVTAHSRRRELPVALRSQIQALHGDLALQAGRLPLDAVDIVFHLAAIAHHRASADEYRRCNLDMTLALAQAAAAGGVARFVFVSSVKAAGHEGNAARGGAPLDYARSKALAEQQLFALGRDSAMDIVVVRPALIYGGEAPGHLALLRRWVRWRLPAPPPGGARSMIGRDDLARLCVELGDLRRSVPARLTVADGEAYTARRLHAALCRSAQRPPLLPSPPAYLWRFGAAAFDRLQGNAPGSTWTRLTGSELSCAAGLEQLGFVPSQTFERSLGLNP